MNGIEYSNYLVSDIGEVYSLVHKRLLGKEVTKDGYFRVSLSEEGIVDRFLLHRIVAETFIPNPQGFSIVDHINMDKQMNYTSNLRWCTHSTNERNKNNKKIDCYDKYTGAYVCQYECIQAAVDDLFERRITSNKGAKAHICSCCKGRVDNVYGYRWKYSEVTTDV